MNPIPTRYGECLTSSLEIDRISLGQKLVVTLRFVFAAQILTPRFIDKVSRKLQDRKTNAHFGPESTNEAEAVPEERQWCLDFVGWNWIE